MAIPRKKRPASQAAQIVGVAMISIAALLLLLTALGGVIGPVGQWIQSFFLGVFGLSFFAFLAATIVLGFFVVRGAKPTLRPLKICCIAGLYLLVVLIVHLITSARFLPGATFGEYIGSCYHSTTTFGGVLFGVVVYPVQWLIGQVFSYILYAFLCIVLVFAWTDFALFRRVRKRSKPIVRAETPAVVLPSSKKEEKAKFVRSPNHVLPKGVSDVGTHSLFVDEIRPAKRPEPTLPAAPRYTPQGKPAPAEDRAPTHGKLYVGEEAEIGVYMPDYITKKHEPPKSEPAIKMPFVAEPIRPAQVVHSETPAGGGKAGIIDGESRSRELESLREREEKIAEAERRLREEEARKTVAASVPPPAPPQPQGKIIVGDEESERLLARKKSQDEAAARINAERKNSETFLVAPSPVSPIPEPPKRIFATPIERKPEPPAEIKTSTPTFNDLLERAQREEPEPPTPEKREEPAADVLYRKTEDKPTDGLDFARAFGIKSEPVAPSEPKKDRYGLFDLLGGSETPAAEEPASEEKPLPPAPGPLLVAEPDPEPDEEESFDEEETEDEEETAFEPEPDYLPPTAGNIRTTRAANSRELARLQLGLDDYMQTSAAEEESSLPEEGDYFRTSARPYVFPPVDLLENNSTYSSEVTDECREKGEMLAETLRDFKIPCEISGISRGPAVSRYEIRVADGVPVGKIKSRADDIAYTLAAKAGVRIEAPIPGKRAVGVEVPNDSIGIVSLREIMISDSFRNNPSPLAFAVGTDVAGKKIVCDLIDMPHLLIAGATGSGKSSCLNSLIVSIVSKVSPDDVRMILIDPKRVEFSIYDGLPHMLLDHAITEWQNALNALNWLVEEYERRYKIFSALRVRNIGEYRKHPDVVSGKREQLPYIVLIVDEMADLIFNNKNEFEDKIRAIAQKARAAGIHMVIATQRPSVDVITGTIKVNLTSRIAFAVTSMMDSRTILDQSGAEKLLGRGDMLYSPSGQPEPIRVQGAYVTDRECHAVVDFIKENNESVFDPRIHDAIYPQKTEEPTTEGDLSLMGVGGTNPPSDELLLPVLWYFIETGKSSISSVQRKFRVGFNRAANIVDELEMEGFIGSDGFSKERSVLISKEEFVAKFGEPTWL